MIWLLQLVLCPKYLMLCFLLVLLAESRDVYAVCAVCVKQISDSDLAFVLKTRPGCRPKLQRWEVLLSAQTGLGMQNQLSMLEDLYHGQFTANQHELHQHRP